MTYFAISRTMSRLPWLFTTSAIRLTPIRNFSIVYKSPTPLLGVPLHTTRFSPNIRSSIIGIRHDSSIAKKLLQTEKKDNFLGINQQFFNREKELKLLSMRLGTEVPKLTIVLGPPNSGKTALVRKVVNSTPNLNPVFIDLRDETFDNVENTITSLRLQFNTYFDHLGNAFKNIKDSIPYTPELTYRDIKLGLVPTNPAKVQFTDLLQEINSRLPYWSMLDGYDVPRPVLVIDEANRFMSLVQTEEGKAMVETFLEWLVVNTKQSLRFHVVLTSSDAFFLQWLQKRLTTFQSMVVGDLTKSEAERFFLDNILPNPKYESVKQELSNKFEQVFNMTGGRMVYIVNYVDQYKSAKMMGEDFEDDQYGDFLKARHYLLTASSPSRLTKLYPERAPAQFSKEQFIKLLKQFVKSSNGFITMKEATDEFGAETVASFVEYNIVHLRLPGKNPDVPGSPRIQSILLPMSRPQLHAMQAFLINGN